MLARSTDALVPCDDAVHTSVMAAAPSTPLTRLAEFLARPVSLVAATRDERMAVEITRCAVARVGDDGRVHVAIPMPEGERTLSNIGRTGVIALSAAYPLDYTTLQIKGTDASRCEWADKQRYVDAHRAQFVDVLGQVGFSALHVERLWSAESVAIAFTPTLFFDQTPGPRAGLPLAQP